jgi:DNA polymerase-1
MIIPPKRQGDIMVSCVFSAICASQWAGAQFHWLKSSIVSITRIPVFHIDIMPTLYLIDGSGFIFRAFHALPPMTRPDGTPVNAVFGYCNMLNKLMANSKIEHIAVIFDAARKTFRHDMYPEYKAHRPPPPPELIPQFSLIREATRAYGIPAIEAPNYEADDLIAAYAKAAVEKGWDVRIVSSDKDLMQLSRKGIEMYDPLKAIPIRAEEVFKKFGVTPDKVVDVQSLIGDSTDNVPGVPGLGPKASAILINEQGSLEALLAAGSAEKLDEILTSSLTKKEAKIFETAGKTFKISSATEVASVLITHYGITNLPLDKKGAPSADAETLERLCGEGNDFARLVVDARNLSRAIGSATRKLFDNAELARISRKLVMLDENAPLPATLDTLIRQADHRAELTAFLQEQGFRSLLAKLNNGMSNAEPSHYVAPPNQHDIVPAHIHPEPDVDYELVQTEERLKWWVDAARANGFVALDTETDSLTACTAKLVGLSLAITPGKACYIPINHIDPNATPSDGGFAFETASTPQQIGLQTLVAHIKDLLIDPATLKVAHNLKYDAQVLGQHGLVVEPFDDTMLLSYVLGAGAHGHGLDELAMRYFQHKMISFDEVTGTGKNRITFDRVPLDKAVAYAAEDADYALRLWQALKPQIAQQHVTRVYERIERPLVPVVAQMERTGVRIDADILRAQSEGFAIRMQKLESEIHALAGHSFNVGSPKQLGDVLFGEMGLVGGTKGKTGAYSTASDVLEPLAEAGHEIVIKLIDYRSVAKLKSTYTDALPLQISGKTGRIHTSFSLVGAATGRLSSTDPNLQNIPIRTEDGRAIRRAFIADEGHTLLSVDYSQIELRLAAAMAGITALIDAFRDKVDIHALTASQVFGIPLNEMTPDKRRAAKAINFGIIYGISGFGLAKQIGISAGEATEFIKQYLNRFHELRDWMETTKEFARDKGYVETLFGRRIHIAGIREKGPRRGGAERAAINAPLQGTAADIMKRAMIRVGPALNEAKLGARLLLQVHDELVFEVPTAELEATTALVKSVMENAPAPAISLAVPLIAEAGHAANWAEAH